MSQPPRYSSPGFDPGAVDGGLPRGPLSADPEGSQDFMEGIVLFDPATDSSPYAAKHKKKKGRAPGKPSAKLSKKAQQKAARLAGAGQVPAQGSWQGGSPFGSSPAFDFGPGVDRRIDSHEALRIVSDDPSEIRRYAEAQRRSDADRTMVGAAGQQVFPSGHAAPVDPAQGETGTSPLAGRPPTGASDAEAGAPGTLPAWSSYEIDDDPAHPRPSARRRGTAIAAGPEGPVVFASESAPSAAGEQEGRPRRHLRAHQRRGKAAEQEEQGRTAEPRRADGEEAGAASGRKARKARRAASRPSARRVHDPEALWRAGIVTLTSVAAILTTIVMLYFPSQSVYLNMRENERLTDELNQNLSRNEQMQDRVETLQTAEGVQDEARRVFGLVLPGENAASVVGVDYEEPTNAVPPEIPRGSGQNTDTWATDLLDRVFGATGPETSTATSTDVATITDQAADASDETAEGN